MADPPETRVAPPAVHGVVADTGLFRSCPISQAMGSYLPATVAFRLINFGRVLLLAWWMTQQQFGLLNMILLIVNVLTPLASFGLNEAVTRYVPQHETRGSLAGFLRRSMMLLAGVTAVSAGFILLLAPTLGEAFYAQVFTIPELRREFAADAPDLARLSAVVIALLVAYFYLLAVLKGLRMFVALSAMELAHGLVFLALAVAAVATGRLSAMMLTVLYGVSLAVPVGLFAVGLRRALARHDGQAAPVDASAVTRSMLAFGLWTMLAGVTWQVLVYYPQWFLNKVHGNEAVAVFSAVRQVGQFVLTAAVAVVAVVFGIVTKTWESEGREAAERQLSFAMRATGLALLLGCCGVALCRDLIIRMFSPAYAAGANILPLQLLFFLLAAYLAFLAIHFQLIERTRHLFWPWATGVAANVVLAFWLAGPRLGEVQASGVWRAAAAVTTCVFWPGFSDPSGLDSATWCGVLAITAALAVCAALVHLECRRLDRGCWFVIAAAGILALRPTLLAAGAAGLLAGALWTDWILTGAERRRLWSHVAAAAAHVPGLRRRRDRGGS